jgi:hypothetical protein
MGSLTSGQRPLASNMNNYYNHLVTFYEDDLCLSFYDFLIS